MSLTFLELRGAFTALITPFSDDGTVDIGALRGLVRRQLKGGIDGLVPCGTTGEAATMGPEERLEVIKAVADEAGDQVPVVAGTGTNDTAKTISFTQRVAGIDGVDAALVVTPYYNKPTQAGMIAHFRMLHDCCELPIIIYNIPGRSVVDMLPATMAELAKLPRIIGVKDATGDVVRVSEQRALCGADFVQLSGEDPSALGFNAHGGVGCISVTANVAPRLCAAFQAATLAGDYAAALEYQDRLMPLHRAIFIEPGLAGAKYALSRLGHCREELRMPLVPVTEPTRETIDAAMRHAGLIN